MNHRSQQQEGISRESYGLRPRRSSAFPLGLFAVRSAATIRKPHWGRTCAEASAGRPAAALVTDHGCQFRRRFRNTLKDSFGISLVKGKVRTYFMNGKAERFFRTFRWWERLTLFFISQDSIQRRADTYRTWYNTVRPQLALDGRVPDEMWRWLPPPVGVPIWERDLVKPAMSIEKKLYRGDPHLAVLEIEVVREAGPAA